MTLTETRSSLSSKVSSVPNHGLKVPSNGRSSFISKLSNLSRSGVKFAFPSWSRGSSAATEKIWTVSEHAQTISSVSLRKEEAIESDVLSELPVGTVVQILALGEGRRLKVRVVKDKLEGWISFKTMKNEALIEWISVESFEVGQQYEVFSMVTVRTEESLGSEMIAKFEPGQIVTILQLGVENKRRVKVISNGDPSPAVEGWISVSTPDKEQLVGKAWWITYDAAPASDGTLASSKDVESDSSCDEESAVHNGDGHTTQTLVNESAVAKEHCTDEIDEDASTEGKQSELIDTASEYETTQPSLKSAERETSASIVNDDYAGSKDCGEQALPPQTSKTCTAKSKPAPKRKSTTKSTVEVADPERMAAKGKAKAKPKAKSKVKAKARPKKPASAEE